MNNNNDRQSDQEVVVVVVVGAFRFSLPHPIAVAERDCRAGLLTRQACERVKRAEYAKTVALRARLRADRKLMSDLEHGRLW